MLSVDWGDPQILRLNIANLLLLLAALALVVIVGAQVVKEHLSKERPTLGFPSSRTSSGTRFHTAQRPAHFRGVHFRPLRGSVSARRQ